MARTVFPTNEIAHLWASKAQPSARNQQGNFYFDGDTIYSYGSHFPIASHVTNKAGEHAVLLTTRERSVTTSRHIQMVRRAIPSNLEVLRVCRPDYDGKQMLERFETDIKRETSACFGPTGRFRPNQWDKLSILIDQANSYCKFYGLKSRWSLPDNKDAVKAAVVAQVARDARKTQREQRAATQAEVQAEVERRAKVDANFQAWMEGDYTVGAYGFYNLPTALRLSSDGTEVETSHGARVPVNHARLLLAVVRRVMASGTAYQRNGHTIHIGHYAVDRIDTDGTVHAGCHHISWEEISRFAPQLEAVGGLDTDSADRTEIALGGE